MSLSSRSDSLPAGPGWCGVVLAMAIPRAIGAQRGRPPVRVPSLPQHPFCGTTATGPRVLVYPQVDGLNGRTVNPGGLAADDKVFEQG